MSTGYSDSDSLNRELQLLDHAVDEIRDDLRRLDDRVDTELHDLRADHDRRLTTLADDLADTTVTADSAAAAVQKLADRVEWLSRYNRRGHGATEADLDSVGADTARDLHSAAAGRRAASTLLPASRRQALQATIDAAQNTRGRWQQSADTLLTGSRDLAASPVDVRRARALRHAARSYRAAVTAYRAATTALATATGAADRARHVLTEDDDRRASLQPMIIAGTRAEPGPVPDCAPASPTPSAANRSHPSGSSSPSASDPPAAPPPTPGWTWPPTYSPTASPTPSPATPTPSAPTPPATPTPIPSVSAGTSRYAAASPPDLGPRTPDPGPQEPHGPDRPGLHRHPPPAPASPSRRAHA